MNTLKNFFASILSRFSSPKVGEVVEPLEVKDALEPQVVPASKAIVAPVKKPRKPRKPPSSTAV